MIEICRDAEFWNRIAFHEAVAPHVFMGNEPQSLEPFVTNSRNLPLKSENGGIILVSLDPLGMMMEMHTMYHPDGWGREVAISGRQFMAKAFETVSLIVTQEQEGNWRSKPPRSHGWQISGDYCSVGLSLRLRLWVLTKEAWLASPVGRKTVCQ